MYSNHGRFTSSTNKKIIAYVYTQEVEIKLNKIQNNQNGTAENQLKYIFCFPFIYS